ncbi:MAG: penicillin-binding protein 2 [Ignavibacteria bacterium]|jgi:penicillin-binding protein 2|nr:penicillin-binding protein 2 [Ignavibacteria bacterium]
MLFIKPLWTNSEPASNTRKNFAKALVLVIFALLVARLAQLQIYQYGQFSTRSQAQAIKRLSITPVRGMMYDRNGMLMVYNIPSFSITITPYEFRNETLPLLASILNMDTSEITTIMKRYRTYSKFTPIKILRDASDTVVARIEEYSDHLPGVDVAIDSKRIYNFDCNMAHLLGYIREITREQLEKNKYYKPGDMIGQNGLEQSYEGLLHGRDGVKFVAIDKIGQRVASFEDGKNDVLASNGFAVNLSIDLQLQELAEKLLSGKRGAVVAIDPNNGEVMVCASKPDYDPRFFSGRVPADIYNELHADKSHPLLPRALQSQYPPGSTWKMLIALAGLQEGIINEHSGIFCNGGYHLGERIWKCHGACGNLDVKRAIRSSCNTFFCELGVRLGMERFEKYGDMFNFGKRTQIDLPFEARGKLPTREWLLSKDKTIRSFTGRLANFGIGQGEILVTPLQMAAYISTIANGGTYYQPHVVKSVVNQITNKTEVLHFDSKRMPIDSKNFNLVKDGMWMVVNAGGTGSVAALPGYNVCGKTGTAQNSQGPDHSWFVCFAPKDNPQIAVCVFVENGGWGASNAAPIAAKILRKFFNPNENVRSDDATNTEVVEEEVVDNQIAD